jgi:hypothetical protein
MDSAAAMRQLRRSGGNAMAKWAILGLGMALAACRGEAPQPDAEAEPIARAFYDEVRAGGDVEADPHVARELKNPTSEAQIAEFRTLIPAEPPDRVEARDANVVKDSVGTTTRLTHVYHYGERTVVARTALFESPSGTNPVIVGFQVSLGPEG